MALARRSNGATTRAVRGEDGVLRPTPVLELKVVVQNLRAHLVRLGWQKFTRSFIHSKRQLMYLISRSMILLRRFVRLDPQITLPNPRCGCLCHKPSSPWTGAVLRPTEVLAPALVSVLVLAWGSTTVQSFSQSGLGAGMTEIPLWCWATQLRPRRRSTIGRAIELHFSYL